MLRFRGIPFSSAPVWGCPHTLWPTWALAPIGSLATSTEFLSRIELPACTAVSAATLGAKQGRKGGKGYITWHSGPRDSLPVYTHCLGSLGKLPPSCEFHPDFQGSGASFPSIWLERWNFRWNLSCLLELLPWPSVARGSGLWEKRENKAKETQVLPRH